MFERSEVTAPRGVVKINGTVLDGFKEMEVTENGFYEADSFRVTFPVDALVAGFTVDELIDAEKLEIDMYEGEPANPNRYSAADLDEWVSGEVDDLSFDPINGTVTLSGRDFTSRFIDAKTTEKWQNNTASEIATALANKRGLTPVVTATTQPVGTYYQIDHARVDEARTEWDLLTWLASQTLADDGRKFVVYTKGRKLYFQPEPKEDDNPYILKIEPPTDERGYPVFDGKTIHFSRSLKVLKDVVVQVKSWNAKTKTANTASYPRSGTSTNVAAGQSEARKQLYSYTIPGLSTEQALQRAQAIHADIVKHQVALNSVIPNDNAMTTRRVIKVTGTGTKFDQVYFPDSIHRVLSNGGGAVMTVTAKNRAPEQQVTL